MAMDDCWLRTEKHDDRNFVRVEDIPIPPSAVTEATNEGGTSSKAKNGKRVSFLFFHGFFRIYGY
jgi:hypothetical protein